MFSFDFEVLEQPLDADAYTVPSPWLPAFTLPAASAEVIGRDAMGGAYVACAFSSAASACCLHLDTRGHVALLGENLEEAVALLIALPYWHELLHSASADVDTLRTHAEELEREVCDDLPALRDARDYLRDFLSLPAIADPVGRLYELAERAHSITVLSPHGWRYESSATRPRSLPL